MVNSTSIPLATRMRPESIEEVLGQDHILGPSRILRRSLEIGKLFSILFWGPPGSGKTTLARLIAHYADLPFHAFSAVLSGVKELRDITGSAKKVYAIDSKPTLLFVDEIHRFNKAQQDAFLPHVESGLIILIGATTHNPSFEVISPLLSRVRVMQVKPLGREDMAVILNRAMKDKEKGLGYLNMSLREDALQYIITISNGDARVALNSLESVSYYIQAENGAGRVLDSKKVAHVLNRRPLLYDKNGEEHYNLISALHKSMRGGDPQASIYWLYRMLEAGEDPLFIGRRLIRFATEDIGLADPHALTIALNAYEAWERVGPPEARLGLAQAVVYLSTAPKSNSLYKAEGSVVKEIQQSGTQPVPLHLRNAPTRLMKNMGYSKGYIYPHDFPDRIIKQEYLPAKIMGKVFYRPNDSGFEKEIKKTMMERRALRTKKS